MNLCFSITVFCALLSNILTIVHPEIYPMKGVSIFILLCSFGFEIFSSLGKKGIDLFRKLKHHSQEFIIPSNSNIFFMPKDKSTFSCISDTNVKRF